MRTLFGLAMSTALTFTLTQAGAAERAPAGTTVTLVTGDVVTLSADGASVDPAPGREGVPITKFHEDGHLYVVPADAGRLIATDRLDVRLFDVTELVRLGYHDDATIPVIMNGGPADLRKGARLPTTGKLWLDGVRTLSLDRTVPQIGAPSAWEVGLMGEGVTIAVLDTGVDHTHPDLAGQAPAGRGDAVGAGRASAWSSGRGAYRPA